MKPRIYMNRHEIVFVIGLLCVLSVFAVTSCAGTRTPPNWLKGYRYRTPITIEESAGYTLKDYQVKIDIQGVDPNKPNCVDFSRIKADASDIRFTDHQHQLINFWIQAWDYTNKTATIWINVPEIQPYQKTTIYLYYVRMPKHITSNFQLPTLRTLTGSQSENPERASAFDRTMTKLVVDRDTRGLWYLDESGGKRIKDSSPNKNHSRIVQATWLGKDGGQLGNEPDYNFSKGNALVFDGKTNYVEILYHKSLDFTGLDKMSIEFWVNPLTYSNYTPVIYKPGSYGLFIMADGRLCSYLYGPKPEDYYFSTSPITCEVWSHIALTYDGNWLKFYINGELDNEIPLTGKLIPCLDRIHNVEYQKSPLYFGLDLMPPGPNYFAGILDEVRILGRVLSKKEIKADFERRTYYPVEPLIAIGEEEKLIPL